MTTNEELQALIDQHFVGPHDRGAIERLRTELTKLGDDGLRAGEEAALRENRRRHFGELWAEQLVRGVAEPGDRELAVWIARSRGGDLVARPYCPAPLVGTWIQSAPRAARWRLGTDGSLETDDAELAPRTRWCVHRTSDDGPDGDELWLSNGEGRDVETLIVDRFSATEVELVFVGMSSSPRHRWRRG